MTDYIVILCTISTYNEAKGIAKELVKKRLAACVNIIEKLTSVYRWKGEIREENECLMIIKSREALFDKLKEEIKLLHPYEVPEIISFPISDGLNTYLDWIQENTD